MSYKRFKEDMRSYINLAHEIRCHTFTHMEEACEETGGRVDKRKTRTEDEWQINHKEMRIV
jgi:hypothetical protein